METGKIAKQMIDFQKAAFNNTFNAAVMIQEQVEKMGNTFLDQSTWLPEEGRKAINEWGQTYREWREDFKKAVDGNFKKAEAFFADANKPAKAKAA